MSFVLLIAAPSGASGQGQDQELKLPFRPGTVVITADETYEGDNPHPTTGAIAFDMNVLPSDSNAELLAIGNGEVALLCTNQSGASKLRFRADGVPGYFSYLHVDSASLPAWMSTEFTRVERGDVIGRMFPDPIVGGGDCSQVSFGPHVHIDLPEMGLVIDRVRFDESFPNDLDRLTSTNGANAPVLPCAELTFKNYEAVDVKVKEVVEGKEVTRHLLAPGSQVTITVDDFGDEWRVRRPSDREKLWEGPGSCVDRRIAIAEQGAPDNDAPALAMDDIASTTSPIVIWGAFDDQSDIVAVKAAVRATGTTTYYRPDGTPVRWHLLELNGLNAYGLAEWETPPLNLPAGDYEIIARATDAFGNRSPWLTTAFRVVADDGPCIDLTVTNDSGEPIKVKRFTPAGERTIEALRPGRTGTYDWLDTEPLVLRRPSNFEKIMSRNLGQCGKVAVTVQPDFLTSITFG